MSIPHKPLPSTMMNSILYNRSAMPLKSPYSVNESPFSMSRVLVSKTIHTAMKLTSDANIKKRKQFYGEKNRDASMVTDKRRVFAQGTKNGSGNQLSFQGSKTVNDERQALHRVRSGGAVVPAKRTARGLLQYSVF